ncbi:MAG TPA: hypothetical protein VFT22_28045 [Kofleriaceae bacterium]|nr:hypothetical protein [Kofleriaceae bacterium]
MTDTPAHPATQDGPADPDATDVPPGNDHPTTAEPTQPDDIAPPLVALLATLRAAVAKGASPGARAAGATACRSILTVLDARPGQPLAPPHPSASPTSPPATLLSQPGLLSKLAAMSRDELIEALKQITHAMPTRLSTPSTAAPRFHLIEIPSVRRPDGT